MEEEKPNKSFVPPVNKKLVKVMISKNRSIEGVGKAGEIVEMTERLARQYERDGYVTILKES